MFINKKLFFFSVNTITIAKPEKGQQVEAAIIQMAQTGQIGGRLSEEELIGLLERFAGSTKKSTVKFDRRRNALDSDDDDDFWYISIWNFPGSSLSSPITRTCSALLQIIKEFEKNVLTNYADLNEPKNSQIFLYNKKMVARP